jgi:hypothetical protein
MEHHQIEELENPRIIFQRAALKTLGDHAGSDLSGKLRVIHNGV